MWGEPIKQSPGIRSAFEKLKEALARRQIDQVEPLLFGQCVQYGEVLLEAFEKDDRLDLNDRDLLTRFFVTLNRGVPNVADLGDMRAAHGFLMAFSAFPYLDVMVDELVVGDFVEKGEGAWLYSQVLADQVEDDLLPVRQENGVWQFDLMPVYQAKADALTAMVEGEFGNDFDAFLMAYVADQDMEFDREKAFTPL